MKSHTLVAALAFVCVTPVVAHAQSAKPSCEQTVRKLIQEHLKPQKQITMSATLKQLGADELDTVELVMAMEEELKIEITDSDAERVFDKTLRDISLYLFQRKACS